MAVFWHGHKNCKYYIVPKTRTNWWPNKIIGNKKLLLSLASQNIENYIFNYPKLFTVVIKPQNIFFVDENQRKNIFIKGSLMMKISLSRK